MVTLIKAVHYIEILIIFHNYRTYKAITIYNFVLLFVYSSVLWHSNGHCFIIHFQSFVTYGQWLWLIRTVVVFSLQDVNLTVTVIALGPFLCLILSQRRSQGLSSSRQTLGARFNFSFLYLNTDRSYKRQGHAPLKHFVGFLCNGGKSE